MDTTETYLFMKGFPTELAMPGKYVNPTLNLSDLEISSQSRTGIILPEFIGVYQTKGIIMQKPSDMKNHDALVIHEIEEILAKEIAAQTFLKMSNGRNDTYHPHLISILYNQDVWSRKHVLNSFKDRPSRVSVIPIKAAPIFEDKDTARLLISQSGDLTDSERMRLIIQERTLLEEQMQEYGLTRFEYALLTSLRPDSLYDGDGFVESDKDKIQDFMGKLESDN